MGEADLSDEWSKGKSSPLIQVTSPIGNLDPYLPALPKYKTKNKPPISFCYSAGMELWNGTVEGKLLLFAKEYGNIMIESSTRKLYKHATNKRLA